MHQGHRAGSQLTPNLNQGFLVRRPGIFLNQHSLAHDSHSYWWDWKQYFKQISSGITILGEEIPGKRKQAGSSSIKSHMTCIYPRLILKDHFCELFAFNPWVKKTIILSNRTPIMSCYEAKQIIKMSRWCIIMSQLWQFKICFLKQGW